MKMKRHFAVLVMMTVELRVVTSHLLCLAGWGSGYTVGQLGTGRAGREIVHVALHEFMALLHLSEDDASVSCALKSF